MASSHAAVAPLAASAPALALDDEQTRAWREDGFLACRQLLGAEELAGVLVALRGVLDDVSSLPREHVFYETPGDAATLKQVQALHTHSAALAALATRGPPAALAAALLSARPVLQNVQLFAKAPGGCVQPTPAHQDAAYFLLCDPASAVTLWLALDDADEETGAVAYVRGSHLSGLRLHAPSGVLGFSRSIVDWTAADADALRVQRAAAGDVLAHHGLTVHCAGANTSAHRPRRAVGFIYYAADAEVDEAASAAYRDKLHAELAAQGRI